MARYLSVGEQAPAFKLQDHDGNWVDSKTLFGEGPTVLYFYPKDDTPGCTAEACAFRDQFESFTDQGVQVVGVSQDDPASHKAFRARHKLPFCLLSDPKRNAHTAYGVGKALGILSGRVTYVIDRAGTVRHVFSSHLQPKRHIDESLAVIATLPR